MAALKFYWHVLMTIFWAYLTARGALAIVAANAHQGVPHWWLWVGYVWIGACFVNMLGIAWRGRAATTEER